MSSDKLKFAFHSVAYNYMGKILSTISTFFTFIMIVRILNIEDYGKYTLYINTIFFAVILFDFGATEVVLRYIPEFLQKKEIYRIKDLSKKVVYVISLASLLSGLIIFSASALAPSLATKFAIIKFLPYIILFGWAKILSFIFSNILNAFFLQAYRISVETIASFLRLILIYLLIHKGIGVWGIIIIYALMDFMIVGLFYLKVRSRLNIPCKLQDNKYYKKIFKFGMGEYFYKLFWFFTDNRFDIYLISVILGMKQAGYLAFAAGIVNLLVDWSPGLIIRPVIAPLFVREYTGKRDSAQVKYLFQLHNKFLMFVSLPIFVLMAVFIDKLIMYIFDPKYLPSMQVFLIFIVSMCFLNIIIPLRNIIFLIERPDISNISNISAIPKIILIYLFAKLSGINGVAVIYTFSLLVTVMINVILIKKSIDICYPWKAFSRIIFNCLIMGIILFSLRSFVTNKLNLLLITFLGVVVYLIMSYLNKAFEGADRDLLNKMFGAKVWNF